MKTKSSIGKLLWISAKTKPGITSDVSHVSQQTKTTSAKLKYLEIFKRSTYYIYPPLRVSSDLKLVAYVDAAHGNLSDEGSVRDTLYF